MEQILNTTITSLKGKRCVFHHFMPTLAIKIALEEGLPLKRPPIDKILKKLKRKIKNGYVKWSEKYPPDYDTTVVARNVFHLLAKPIKKEIKLSFSKEGGVYTYLGGLKSKSNNSVDVVINIIILDYLIKNRIGKDRSKLVRFLKKKKIEFKQDINEISKYYLSEGFFIYSLSKIAETLNLDVESLIKLKLKMVKNKTDIGFLILASSKLNEKIINKFKKANEMPLNLFQYPRLKLKFSCPYLDKIVRKCAELKIEGANFDEIVAKKYSQFGDKLYSYKRSFKTMVQLFEKLKLKDKKLVELGVGTANLSKYFLSEGYGVLGVDISEEMLKIAKKKTSRYNKAKYILQDIRKLKLKKPVKIMYSHNFIDFRGDKVELWTETIGGSIKAIKSISKNLQKRGILFIRKKESKKSDKKFHLFSQKIIRGESLVNTYIYRDKEIIMRRQYRKTIMDKKKFNNIMKRFGLRLVDKNRLWLVYRKN